MTKNCKIKGNSKTKKISQIDRIYIHSGSTPEIRIHWIHRTSPKERERTILHKINSRDDELGL